MVEKLLDFISAQDKEVADAMAREVARQRGNIELIASENFVSEAVMAAVGSPLTNKYAEGYPGRRYYGGCQYVDESETIAIERLKQIFGCKFANVQPHSGAQANHAVYLTLCAVGDTVLGMDLDAGGHLTHGSKVNFSGKQYNIVSYGVDESGRIDYDAVRKIALECKPKMIVAGASAYPRVIDFKKFSEIAKECGAYLFVDMAHIAGLVAAGEHPTPFGHADVVTSTTHKTLRGPRGGIIMTDNEELAKKLNSAVFPGLQGGPLEHVIAGKAVAFGEALRPEFKTYQTQVVKNCAAMANSLLAEGVKLVSGGTDNHLCLLDLRETDVSGMELEHRLDEVHITTNKNKIPNDPRTAKETSGLRLGAAAATTRGFDEADFTEIGKLIALAIRDFEASKGHIITRVAALCDKHPLY